MNKGRLFFISLAFVLSSFSHGQELTLSVNDWCPYICDLSAPQKGILIEIVQDVFQTEGYQVNFKKMPLKRAVLEIKNNRVQGMVGIVPDVFSGLIFPEEPVIKTQFCFFTLPQKRWEFKGFKQRYPGTSVGVVSGKNISSNFDEAFPQKETVSGYINTAERLIEMLVRHRVDTILEEKTTISYLLKKDGSFPDLRIAGCAGKKDEYVAFSPADPMSNKYAELFSKGMKRLKKSGKIEEIVSSYID